MKNNKEYISQHGITVITEIKPGQVNALEDLLYDINKSYKTNEYVDFSKFKLIHYIRWFIIDKAVEADGTEVPPQLAMTSNFDLGVDEHLQELLEVGASMIPKIYVHCEGFPAGESADNIIAYFKKHQHDNQLFWPAIRGGTVEQIRGEALLRDRIQLFVNDQQKQGKLTGKSQEEIRETIKGFVAGDNELSWALEKRATPTFGWRLKYWWLFIRTILVIVLVIAVWVFLKLPWWLFLLIFAAIFLLWLFVFSNIYGKKDDREREEIKRSKEMDELLRNEDQIFQNQLTIYGAIKKPYWYRLTTLKLGLLIFSINGTYRSNKGQLSGIETIHFARWALFNNGKNVMFLSNYDGAWEMYLSEFIDRSAMAMNLTFGTTLNYPPTKRLLWEGAFNEQAFKTVVRNNQYPCQMWWSAYPYITVKNILNNAMIRMGLNGSSEESVEQWLKRI